MTHLASGQPVNVGRVEKMSKSKHNVVEPNPLIERLGADTVRLFSFVRRAAGQGCQWDDESVEGCYRFLNRFWKLVSRHEGFSPRRRPLTAPHLVARPKRCDARPIK